MKLRRTMALAAATAVIAPAAILAAPAAFAETTDGTAVVETTDSPAPSASESTDAEATPSASASVTAPAEESEEPGEPGPDKTADAPGDTASNEVAPKPSDSASVSSSPSASTSAPSSDSEDQELPAECSKSDLDISINGLPGKIARGSGWHQFKMNVYNSSKSVVKEIDYFAGASSDKDGYDLFKSKHVSLQALDQDTNKWEDLSEDGRAVGYVGQSDEIRPGYEVDIPLRINVKSTAPIGAGFTLGAGLYVGDKDCLGFSDVAYKFKIVNSGESGSTPQTGGTAPVPTTKPADNPTGKVSGSLAETGSSSAVPVFATAGGAAIVLGAGAMFIVRRRRNGDAAA
ncbi:LAETG motif-containing sortase-dependent surface protein [Streptomyces sp. NBC_01618]|uniref:LAETG motif-containing sortase-dependent surface protein n=1 Tax=Streptomyces sp. NBC_01618 TaxID=2975900 RepID=UPI003868361B|nr:LPXTG cell wall anchor domain-containing protein [Streptomyces sp. NBC_01618]